MSEHIYPKGYDPEMPINVDYGDGNSAFRAFPSESGWPIMLGLLTIISDAIAAAPWWGDGESEPVLPEVGSVWVGDKGHVWVISDAGFTRGASIDSSYFWVSGDDGEAMRLTDFARLYRPALVVPTPTADDWIDPAVRLPEVGEWVWLRYTSGGVDALQVSPYIAKYGFDTRLSPRAVGVWAPIIIGPPPIP
jgi:hypothetical protein